MVYGIWFVDVAGLMDLFGSFGRLLSDAGLVDFFGSFSQLFLDVAGFVDFFGSFSDLLSDVAGLVGFLLLDVNPWGFSCVHSGDFSLM
ncbi:hypothetical protein [Paenibacillus albus]|uniref:Uncharacterized protein n=1 Tax=Paenibacillus albus TaxID=2495582 RepID=A0A3Q8X955_9BACL|nr:hypothetical protein [Paenibacillus albus]AZN43401.1 hypothetical protein EJC50_29700 [Paenibacillus albus]